MAASTATSVMLSSSAVIDATVLFLMRVSFMPHPRMWKTR